MDTVDYSKVLDEWKALVNALGDAKEPEKIRQRVALQNSIDALNEGIADGLELPPVTTVHMVSSTVKEDTSLREGEIEITAERFENVTQRGYSPSQIFPYIYSVLRVGKARKTFWSPQAAGATGEWNYKVIMDIDKNRESFQRILGRTKLSFTVYNKPHYLWFSSKICYFRVSLAELAKKSEITERIETRNGIFTLKFRTYSPENRSTVKVETSMSVLTAPILSTKGKMAFNEFNTVFGIDASKLQADLTDKGNMNDENESQLKGENVDGEEESI